MPYLFDTNIFVRLASQSDPQRLIALEALRRLRTRGEGLVYTPQVLNEFWNICTRPASARGGLGLSPIQTERKAGMLEKYFRLLPDSLATHQEWRRLVSAHSIMGVQVYDARLVASMVVYGIDQILTFNVHDFQRFPQVSSVHPKDVK